MFLHPPRAVCLFGRLVLLLQLRSPTLQFLESCLKLLLQRIHLSNALGTQTFLGCLLLLLHLGELLLELLFQRR
jgi:hypothetical protein